MKVRTPSVVLLVASAVAATFLSLVPAAATQAQAPCLTADYQANHWTAGSGTGGFASGVTIANDCASPVTGWTLELTLPAGHTLSHGWSAVWTAAGDQLTATPLSWNTTVNPGEPITIGFIGSWADAYQDPVSCLLNGVRCDGGDPVDNLPPEVAVTTPSGGSHSFIAGCPLIFAADASDPDGAVERVEFHVNGVRLGTDDAAPYEIATVYGAIPPPTSSPGTHVAVARAYDDGQPQLSTDSQPETFTIAIGDPAPESLLACRSSQELAAGSTEEVRFVLYSAVEDEVTLTVTGDPGITVSPTTVAAAGNVVLATVSAGGSAGATATIRATAGDLSPAAMSITIV